MTKTRQGPVQTVKLRQYRDKTGHYSELALIQDTDKTGPVQTVKLRQDRDKTGKLFRPGLETGHKQKRSPVQAVTLRQDRGKTGHH